MHFDIWAYRVHILIVKDLRKSRLAFDSTRMFKYAFLDEQYTFARKEQNIIGISKLSIVQNGSDLWVHIEKSRLGLSMHILYLFKLAKTIELDQALTYENVWVALVLILTIVPLVSLNYNKLSP